MNTATRAADGRPVWHWYCVGTLLLFSARLLVAAPSTLPTLEVSQLHTVITQSCRVVIPAGLVLVDREKLGVIQIGASGIEIEFAKGTVLRGSQPDVAPDQYQGFGLRINGHKGVTIRNLQVSGFWCGIQASNAVDLTLENVDASDNRRARLLSTPASEDETDWLYGHDNDGKEWLTRYGAAMYIEQSSNVVVRNSRVWHGQNGLCLDRVSNSRIYDNDFSFNSGWGIAMWRCSSNIVTRNAFDFCVRGYSHGVYNRGQDSAGIFAFEQNVGNIFAENSVTHGGDGFFGFAGREALGEIGDHPVEWYKGRGNSNNLLLHNDFSYAAAHGIENTFSFGNKYLENRIVGNAICGIWAGYSRNTLIASNDFQNNGEMGYGLERGGVDIDHGGDNFILGNRFFTNKCGIHIWGGLNPEFEKKNWANANGYDSTGSVIEGNLFRGDSVAFQFRGPGEVTLGSNQLVQVSKEMLQDPAYQVRRTSALQLPSTAPGEFPIWGTNHPVGARAALRGRENIIMTEWGPWDHLTPLARQIKASGGSLEFEVLNLPRERLRVEARGAGVHSTIEKASGKPDVSRITISTESGVHPFELKISDNEKTLANFSGTLLNAKWKTTFFKWSAKADPRTNFVSYRELAESTNAVSEVLNQLSFHYGMRGPSELGLSEKITSAKLGQDHFGMVATTRIPLTAGTWEFKTESDDGVRVSVDGKPIIENWTWHGPTHDSGSLTLATPRVAEIVVEHFQIDGYAVLEFGLSRKADSAGTRP